MYLCIMFNLFLMSGYIPDAFCQSTIIPLVKCKSGDLSDVNNYRAIALSNSASKILETLLFDFIETSNTNDNYQFGFRKKTTLHQYARMFLRRQLTIIDSMAVMFSLASSTLIKLLTMLITGCFLQAY